MAEILHETVHYTGHVQGVGFRHAVLQVAREFEVAGFVQNLADGRVRLEVEGRAGVLEEFLAVVGERMHGHIRKVERSAARRAPQFSGFVIR